jgi:hypothetical protein
MFPRVYLSYAPADAAFAARLRDDLRAAGAGVDESPPGLDGMNLSSSDAMVQINGALARHAVLVAVLSPEALGSARVEREMYLAAGRASSGAMRPPLLVRAAPVADAQVPLLWRRFAVFDAARDYTGAFTLLGKTLEGKEEEKPTGIELLRDGEGLTPRTFWERLGVRGVLVVLSALVILASLGLSWYSVGLTCAADVGCEVGPTQIAPGPNDVDAYYLASGKLVNVNSGTAQVKTPGAVINDGYVANNGLFDPTLPRAVGQGTSAVVLQGELLFTVAPTLSFGYTTLGALVPIAIIMLLLPLLVAAAGFLPVIRKVLLLLPAFAALFVVGSFIIVAPESFHNSELIHFAPGPGGGAWLAFLFTIVALVSVFSISTKPATQKVA